MMINPYVIPTNLISLETCAAVLVLDANKPFRLGPNFQIAPILDHRHVKMRVIHFRPHGHQFTN